MRQQLSGRSVFMLELGLLKARDVLNDLAVCDEERVPCVGRNRKPEFRIH